MATIAYTSSGFTYGALIEESASKLQLALQDNISQTFNQPFTSDSGFTYDSDKAEFTGGQVQQIDLVPTNAISGAIFDTDVNLESWSGGVVTGAAQNGAAISGGKLDLTGGTAKYIIYDANFNADSQQVGAYRVKYTPAYSGSPAGDRTFFAICALVGDTTNLVHLRHLGTGGIQILIKDGADVDVVNYNTPSWSPTASTEYEIELNWDLTTGATRLFIDGTQLGVTQTATGIRNNSINNFIVGSNYNGADSSDCHMADIVYFSTVQHTADYTPGYVLGEYKYEESKVELPQFSYSGPGSVQAFTNLATTETNAPQEIWNDLYWSGSAWVSSDGSFSQSNTKADIITNIATFPASDTLDIDIVFEDSNSTQMSMNDLTITYTGQIYSDTDPTFETTIGINAEAISSFVNVDSATGSDAVTYILSKDDTWYYWTGSAWAESDETYSQSNSGADVATNIATLVSTEIELKARGFLHSDDGSTTPNFTSITMIYTEWLTIDFIVEDGTSKTDSTSYATVAQYKQYWKNRGTDRDATYTDSQIQGRLNLATEYIDNNYNFYSEVTETTQALEWPRYSVPDGRGDYIDNDEIPTSLINATCYMADQDELEVADSGVSAESYGPVSKTYSRSSGSTKYPILDKYLKHYILGKVLKRVN